MWTEQDQQFVESAARAMWSAAWADHEEQTCTRCGGEVWGDDERGSMCDLETPCEGRTYPGEELTSIAPPTPQYALLCAARLLGTLEQANGSGLTVILESARKVETAMAALSCDHTEGGQVCRAHDGLKIDVREFASAIALEALGHGVSWFDDHERFDVPARPEDIGLCEVCGHRESSSLHKSEEMRGAHRFRQRRSEFTIPKIEFEYQED
jgi:hypothetical protein